MSFQRPFDSGSNLLFQEFDQFWLIAFILVRNIQIDDSRIVRPILVFLPDLLALPGLHDENHVSPENQFRAEGTWACRIKTG